MKKPTRTSGIALLLASLVGAAGCAPQERPAEDQPSPSPSRTADVDPATKDRVLKAKDALLLQLSSELMAAMTSGGPAAAIEICGQKAPVIAEEVGREHGVSIGRTSFKLRNDKNQPPEWAAELVKQRVEEPRFVELGNQRTGALLPIHLQPHCLMCHGPEEQIPDGVKQQLTQHYPRDRATGFQAGDLRGWFWIESPGAE